MVRTAGQPGGLSRFLYGFCKDFRWNGEGALGWCTTGRDEAVGVQGGPRVARLQQISPRRRLHRRVPGPGKNMEGQEDGGPHGQQTAHRAQRARLQGARSSPATRWRDLFDNAGLFAI